MVEGVGLIDAVDVDDGDGLNDAVEVVDKAGLSEEVKDNDGVVDSDDVAVNPITGTLKASVWEYKMRGWRPGGVA